MSRTKPDEIGPPVPFDPELAAALEVVRDYLPRFEGLDSIPAARQVIMAGLDTSGLDRRVETGALSVMERTIPGPAGAPDIDLFIVRPTAAAGPTPALYYTHGGGMILGTARGVSEEFLEWVERFGCTLISVEYRLAPETPHPGPVEDCYAGLVWTAEHTDELNIDPDRIVVFGSSAGGGLAAATTLMARDRRGPKIAAQFLMCPMLDDRNDTASAIQGEGIGTWDRRANQTGWTALLGDARGGPDVSEYAAPARATDLTGLPPTFIDVGAAETFRDEAVAYASRLWRAGVDAELHVFAGGFHGYDALAPHAAVSKDTRDLRVAWLTRFFER
ncbi:alpha/beta hydrolase [Agromyces salentinus]|uniref:Alpha/beta hydrolase n=1 Tax=Agromyces salentinus TaxID=269421 RepID=A0ABP4ZBJ9_9MICO|nr:alpha/beta hydrolase [Agromyces salentinus]